MKERRREERKKRRSINSEMTGEVTREKKLKNRKKIKIKENWS